MKTFDDSYKFSTHRQLLHSTRGPHTDRSDRSRRDRKETLPPCPLAPATFSKVDSKLSIGATNGDTAEESEPLNLNFELLLNTNRSEQNHVDDQPKLDRNKSSSSSLGGNCDFDYAALDSDAGGGEIKNMEMPS